MLKRAQQWARFSRMANDKCLRLNSQSKRGHRDAFLEQESKSDDDQAYRILTTWFSV
jgi:hypothetical protein